MVSNYKIGLWICAVFSCLLLSCTRYGQGVDKVLALSGENKTELEKVLEYYQDSILKLKAAKFLITNMPGLYVVDTASLAAHRPFYQICDSIRLLYKATQRKKWAMLVDSLWDVYKQDKSTLSVRRIPLFKAITAKQMIAEIEMAFAAWKPNAYSKNCSFEDFCEYILPFYRGSNFVLDDARLRFYQKYGGKFYQKQEHSLLVETDSLLYKYKDIGFDTFYGSDIPALNVSSLIQMGGGRCTERGMFNSLLLSALGVPVAVDFVPLWGNRTGAHSWNVLLAEGKQYAFDPFWNEDNWVYSQLYANSGSYDPSGLGEFRLPKVYRKTYSTHWENTLLDKGVPLEDVPPLFRNFKMKDVSSDYFEATDVEVNLSETPPQSMSYAYLCVYDFDGWKPVQYGKIEDSKAFFAGMGKNIVYLPMYYKNGMMSVAASPFLLKSDGAIHTLNPIGKADEIVVINSVDFNAMSSKNYLNCMRGTFITGCAPDRRVDTLCQITNALPAEHTTFQLAIHAPYRFLRVNLPSDSIALGDLSFYSSEGKVPDARITSAVHALQQNGSPDLIFDEFKTTCYRAKAKEKYMDIDLGKEYVLTSIEVSPYVKSFLFPNSWYELSYWADGWKSLGKQKGGVDYLVFKNVPRNVLLRLKQESQKDWIRQERVFIYENGEILWM